MARYYTNTDDVLNYSNDAITAGLPQAFKGTGVVVGVIDGGIDFQHRMFKDANGNSRIKRAYVARGAGSFTTYTSVGSSPTTDDSSDSHGTHTSTTAAGSEITVNGTVYGGMAPEASLVLVGCGQYLYNTNIANGIKYIFDYADSQNMPAVCSISLGSHMGPHDGTGELAATFSQYAGINPNHIIVYATVTRLAATTASSTVVVSLRQARLSPLFSMDATTCTMAIQPAISTGCTVAMTSSMPAHPTRPLVADFTWWIPTARALCGLLAPSHPVPIV